MTRTNVISLGAGVQSSVMVLLAARGEIDAQLAIFSDTGHEPAAVYDHLRFLEREVAGRVEIVRVQEMDLRDAALAPGGFNPIPLYTGEGGVGRRQCTYQAKLRPLRRELRRRGYGPSKPVRCLLGISTNEIQRVKPSGKKWIENAWPLIDLGMSRADCIRWAEENGYPAAPRSACTFCPYHSDAEWREMRETDPTSWQQAVDFDNAIRVVRGRDEYVHRSLTPLAEVDLSTPADRGQLSLEAMDECEGGCFL